MQIYCYRRTKSASETKCLGPERKPRTGVTLHQTNNKKMKGTACVYIANAAQPDPPTLSPKTFNTQGPKNLFTLSKVALHKYPKQIKTAHPCFELI